MKQTGRNFDFSSLDTGVYEIYVYTVGSGQLKNYAFYSKWLSTIDGIVKESLEINIGESLAIFPNALYTGSWYTKVYMYKVSN